jgi:hypothetical protein
MAFELQEREIEPMKRKRLTSRGTGVDKVACTVSAAALMLGVSQAATVGFNFQTHYCAAASYSGAVVTAPAFGIGTNGWESLSQMDTGYGCPASYFTLNQVIDTNSAAGGLNPLPNGSLNVTWSGYTANVSGFGGYTRSGPHYTFGGNGYKPGNEQVYWGFIRDGVNFGPGSSSGDNNQPGYVIDITGLKSLFTSNSYAVQLIASADSMQYLTNAFIIDATANTTQSVVYPSTPPVNDALDTAWIRGIGGGLSTASGAVNADHLQIIGNRAAHVGPKTGYNFASTISGFIITDKPVLSMPPNPVVVCETDTITWSGYAVGVPPLSYQWRHNGTAIPGATGTSFGITNVSLADRGYYDLVVTNAYGSVTSAPLPIDRITTQSGTNFITDSNPVGPENDGLNYGATWLASSGGRTGVMSFNAAATNQVVVPGSTNFDATTGTVAFWMRSSTVLTTNEAMLFDRRNPSGFVLVQSTNGTVRFEATHPDDNEITSAATNLSDNAWHLITLTFDQSSGGECELYVDGTLDSLNGNANGWAWTPGEELEFGLSHDIANFIAYNGQLSDIRYYNRKLTSDEVKSVFSSGDLVDTNSLVMRLDFAAPPGAGALLRWQCPDALLQSSDSVEGPYSDVQGAQSPYPAAAHGKQKYYRYHGHTTTSILSNPYLM